MNRRKTNRSVMGSLGAQSQPGRTYSPSKKDLFDILNRLRHKSPPEVEIARATLVEATKTRKDFERGNRTWRRLRRAERVAEREFERIQDSERDRWEKGIVECRDILRLYGVTPQIVQRIENLLYGKED